MGYAINGLIKAEQLDFLTFLTRSISPKLTLPGFVRSARLRTVSSSTFTSSVQPPLIRNSRRGKLKAGRVQQGLRNTPDRELENPRANKKYFKCQEQAESRLRLIVLIMSCYNYCTASNNTHTGCSKTCIVLDIVPPCFFYFCGIEKKAWNSAMV